MELDDLIIAWKKQDENIHRQLQNETLKHLLKQRSQGALSKIKQHLIWEFAAIAGVFILFNSLFLLVHLPGSTSRWACFILFNSVCLWFMYYYLKISSALTLQYAEDIKLNMQRIASSLQRFLQQYKLLNLPVVFLCILIFAGTQNILVLAPWMIAEFILWRAILLPKLMARFEGYIGDLEYSLRSLQELVD